jgi:hypothetical protein
MIAPVSIGSQRTAVERAISRIRGAAQKLKPAERELEERYLRAVLETLSSGERDADRLRNFKDEGQS